LLDFISTLFKCISSEDPSQAVNGLLDKFLIKSLSKQPMIQQALQLQ
jgi:hypothetical protein